MRIKKEIEIAKIRPTYKDVWHIFYAWIFKRYFYIRKIDFEDTEEEAKNLVNIKDTKDNLARTDDYLRKENSSLN